MLDLKAKLASAGLVSDEDIKRVEKSKRRGSSASKKKRGGGGGGKRNPRLDVAKLANAPKGEVYDAVRRWVDKVRLDPSGGTPPDDARAFHFAQATGKIGRLMLAPTFISQLEKGEAGVVAFMSNHGLAHAVVPSACARLLADLNPLWLRFLDKDPRAGQVERPEPPREATDEPASNSADK